MSDYKRTVNLPDDALPIMDIPKAIANQNNNSFIVNSNVTFQSPVGPVTLSDAVGAGSFSSVFAVMVRKLREYTIVEKCNRFLMPYRYEPL